MGRPSNPRLMARVLEAVKHLGEAKGSSARQVLELLRQGNKPPTRNLAMQVQRALKNAVTAGLLQLRSGRYKMLISLQNAVKRRGTKGNANNTTVGNPSSKKKEDPETAEDSGSLAAVEAGPRSRCSHCKKHKRKGGRRKRKRSASRRRKRSTKRASERKSRKLRRRGEAEVTNRRERRGKMPAPGSRSKSEVPERKTNPDTNEDRENNESGGRRDRSESCSDSGDEEEGPKATKAKLSSAGRRNHPSSRRSGSKPRRTSRRRNSSVNKAVENDAEDTARMESCDDGPELAEENGDNAREENSASHTSI